MRIRRIPPRSAPSRTMASRYAVSSTAGSITVAPSTPPPSTIVFVPGPVISEGLGARMIVYGFDMLHLQLLALLRPIASHMLRHIPRVSSVSRKVNTRYPILLCQYRHVCLYMPRNCRLQRLLHTPKGG